MSVLVGDRLVHVAVTKNVFLMNYMVVPNVHDSDLFSLHSQGRYGCCRFLRDGYKTPKEVGFFSPK